MIPRVTHLPARARAILADSRALNSRQTDTTVANHWTTFLMATHRNGLELRAYDAGTSDFHHQDLVLREFVAYLESRHLAPNSVKTYLKALGTTHLRTLGYDPIARHPVLDKMIHGLEKRYYTNDRPIPLAVAPLTVELLNTTIHLVPPSDIRMRTLVITGVYFILRISNLIKCPRTDHHLRKRDIAFDHPVTPSTVFVTVMSAKHHARPRTMPMARNNSATCPVAALHTYLASRSDLRPDQDLFEPARGQCRLDRKMVAAQIARMGLPSLDQHAQPSKFTTKSMRYGGTTTLCESDTPTLLVEKHGGWTSDKAMKGIYFRATKNTAQRLANGMGR
jgi:hypothetical protein